MPEGEVVQSKKSVMGMPVSSPYPIKTPSDFVQTSAYRMETYPGFSDGALLPLLAINIGIETYTDANNNGAMVRELQDAFY